MSQEKEEGKGEEGRASSKCNNPNLKGGEIGIYDQGSASEAFFTLTEDRSVKEYSYVCFLLTDMLRNVSEYSTKSLTPLCATMVVLSL